MARGRIMCPTPLFMLWFGLTRVCMGFVTVVTTAMSSYWQLPYCVQMLPRSHPLPLVFIPFLCPEHRMFPEPWGITYKFHSRLGILQCHLHLGQLWVCVNQHLLQVEASQMMVERCLLRRCHYICEYNDNSLGIGLILCPLRGVLVVGSFLGPMNLSSLGFLAQ